MTRTSTATFLSGAACAVLARRALGKALRLKFEGDLARLNAGDYTSLLRSYHPDAVLTFTDGDHRWAGVHRGRAAIERFLQNFTAAKIQGEIVEVLFAGPPWALTAMVRFDDGARGPDGQLLYENRTVLVVRTRWGRIVEHEDFYVDTGRIAEFEQRLRELGVAAV